jgi:hypothetical protein
MYVVCVGHLNYIFMYVNIYFFFWSIDLSKLSHYISFLNFLNLKDSKEKRKKQKQKEPIL